MNQGKKLYNNWIFKLVILNGLVFFLQNFLDDRSYLTLYLGLTPAFVLEKGFIWQFFSYMFLHGDFFHIFLNMYALLLFGIPVAQVWGEKKFLFYYFFTGLGAGITIFVINTFFVKSGYYIPTIGASGAVFGLLLAFGLLFPETELLLFFILPIKAKYLIFLYGGIEFYSLITSGGSTHISHVGHLGGLFFGFLFFLINHNKKENLAKTLPFNLKKNKKKKNLRVVSTSKKRTSLLDLYKKIKTESLEALSDDEFQELNYYKIMYEDEDDFFCPEELGLKKEKCLGCSSLEKCLLKDLD